MGDKQVKQEGNKRKVPKTTFADRPQDINRNGRPPKEHCLTDLLKEALDKEHTASGKTNKEMIIDKMFELANKGDSIILKYLFDRIDGRPMQPIQADIKAEGFQITIIEPPEDAGV